MSRRDNYKIHQNSNKSKVMKLKDIAFVIPSIFTVIFAFIMMAGFLLFFTTASIVLFTGSHSFDMITDMALHVVVPVGGFGMMIFYIIQVVLNNIKKEKRIKGKGAV